MFARPGRFPLSTPDTSVVTFLAGHTPDLAKLIVNAGGVAAMVDYITEVGPGRRADRLKC
jgi:hypothetical protein